MTKGKKIDWLNHLIAFFSALLGILIAFQLENYREDLQEKREVKQVISIFKSEIENNLEIYRKNVNQIGGWLEYWKLVKKGINEGIITIEKGYFDQLKKIQPERYTGWEILEDKDEYFNQFSYYFQNFLYTDDYSIDLPAFQEFLKKEKEKYERFLKEYPRASEIIIKPLKN